MYVLYADVLHYSILSFIFRLLSSISLVAIYLMSFPFFTIHSIISPLLIISLSSLIRLLESFIFIWFYFGYIYVMLKDEITYI